MSSSMARQQHSSKKNRGAAYTAVGRCLLAKERCIGDPRVALLVVDGGGDGWEWKNASIVGPTCCSRGEEEKRKHLAFASFGLNIRGLKCSLAYMTTLTSVQADFSQVKMCPFAN